MHYLHEAQSPSLLSEPGFKDIQRFQSVCCAAFQRSQTRVWRRSAHIVRKGSWQEKMSLFFLPKQCSFCRYHRLLASNLSSCPRFVCSVAATCGGDAKSAAPAMHTNKHMLCEHESIRTFQSVRRKAKAGSSSH